MLVLASAALPGDGKVRRTVWPAPCWLLALLLLIRRWVWSLGHLFSAARTAPVWRNQCHQRGRRHYLDNSAMHRRPNSMQPPRKCFTYNWYFIVYFGDLRLSMTLCCTKQLECFYLLFQILGRIVVINEPWNGMIYGSVASRCTAESFVQIKPCLKVLKFFRVTSLLPCHNSHYKSLKLPLPF